MTDDFEDVTPELNIIADQFVDDNFPNPQIKDRLLIRSAVLIGALHMAEQELRKEVARGKAGSDSNTHS